eukprot:6206903-Pleurochrysis_carterae.AAC.1
MVEYRAPTHAHASHALTHALTHARTFPLRPPTFVRDLGSQFLGGSTESMWLLTDTQLAKQCELRGVNVEGKDRDELLAALAAATNRKALTDGGQARVRSQTHPIRLAPR